MKRRLWLVDQLLRDGVGHHAGYNRCIAGAAAEAGIEVVVVGHRDLDPRLLAPHRVERVFRNDWRAAPPTWTSTSHHLLRALEKISAVRFRADLRRWAALTAPDDLVFAQMIAPRHLAAWLSWASQTEGPPRLVFHLGYQPHRFARPDIARALEAVPAAVRKKIIFATDSEKLVDPLQKILGGAVSYLPHVVGWNFSASENPKRAGATVFVPGNARREKGFADIIAALHEVGDLLSSGKLRFRIQCHHPDDICRALLAEKRAFPGVEWIDRPLTDAEYVRSMEDCDLVLVPYHLDHYEARTSGVFCEARTAGKPVLATRGSWAGDRVAREDGGWLCEERNPASLARALRDAITLLPDTTVRAAALRTAARAEFSPDRFVEKLQIRTCSSV